MEAGKGAPEFNLLQNMGMNRFVKVGKPLPGAESVKVRLPYEDDRILSQLRNEDESAGFFP